MLIQTKEKTMICAHIFLNNHSTYLFLSILHLMECPPKILLKKMRWTFLKENVLWTSKHVINTF